MFIVVPVLEGMSPVCVQVLSAHVVMFATWRSEGKEWPGMMLTADRLHQRPLVLAMKDSASDRAVQVSLAAGYLRHREQPIEVVLLADTFVSTYGEGEDPGTRGEPSQDPQASECLLVNYATAKGSWACSLPYGWSDDGALVWRTPSGWIPAERMESVMWEALRLAIEGPEMDDIIAAQLDDPVTQNLVGITRL